MTTSWHAVYTQPRMELWARSNLWERGIKVYLPLYRKRRRHARRNDWVSAPLFPRYLFVRADLAHTGRRAIASARGVVNLVCCGSEPSNVHPSIIDAIREREDDLGIIRLERSFGQGEPLRICEGPFVDLPAIFECESDDRRIVVLLNMLGRQTRVRIAREQVSAAT